MNKKLEYLNKVSKVQKHKFSVISDLENETENTYNEVLEFRTELRTELANYITRLESYQDKVFNEHLNAYSDINDKLLDAGIKGTDFTVKINENIENSIAEIDDIKQLLF